jgi:hypothetical protein
MRSVLIDAPIENQNSNECTSHLFAGAAGFAAPAMESY